MKKFSYFKTFVGNYYERFCRSIAGRKNAGTFCFVAVLSIFMLFAVLTTYARNVQKDIADSVLRLHVIANSDSEADQELKMKVKERIVAETKEIFAQSGSIEDTRKIASEHLDEIERAAMDEVRRGAFDYEVRVEIGKFPFPTKTYGDVAFPAGQYDAVRVVIGEGRGENWWCVLFPPLCFANGTTGTLTQEAKEELKKALTEEEYALVTENNEKNASVQVKFKIVEIFAGFFK